MPKGEACFGRTVPFPVRDPLKLCNLVQVLAQELEGGDV
jgi:hypothetical protein